MKRSINSESLLKEATRNWPLMHASVAIAGTVTLLLLGMITTHRAQGADSSVNIRPIEDFLKAQGSGGNGIGAPFSLYLGGWDPEALLFFGVDHAGLVNKWLEKQSGGAISLGTVTEGTIIERPLPDGRAEVTVLLHSRNALTWVSVFDPAQAQFPPLGDLLFGHFAEDVLAGADPALGESFLQWVFINDAPGAPLPDIFVEAVPLPPAPAPHEWIMISMEVNAAGTLREAFGVPEGTPGRAQSTQIGRFQTAGKGATADGWPVEQTKLRIIGR